MAENSGCLCSFGGDVFDGGLSMVLEFGTAGDYFVVAEKNIVRACVEAGRLVFKPIIHVVLRNGSAQRCVQ